MSADDWIEALRVAILVLIGIGVAKIAITAVNVFTYFFFGS